MDLNLNHEVATLQKNDRPRAAETLCRGLRRAHRGQQQSLADQTHRLASASLGGRRPLRTSPPAGCRVGQRCQSPSLPTKDLSPGCRSGPDPTRPVHFQADSRLPPPGTILTRKYKGQDLQVQVLAEGFLFQGQVFGSLSAVAKAITGSHCNGFLFFRLTQQGADS